MATQKPKNGKPKWKNFEESAMQTSTTIYGKQTVLANQRVMGSISQTLRQIDIKVGDNAFIDIECKDHSKPVDLPIVEQFANKLKDEGAKKGVIVSNSGFTESALKTAKHYDIRAAVLIDKGNGDTSNFIIKVPVVAVGYYLDSISYGVAHNRGQDFRFSPLVWDMLAAEGSENPRNLFEVFRDHWNQGTIEIAKEGSYQYQFDDVAILDLRGDVIAVDITYRYTIKSDKRMGEIGAENARGFFDINTNTFTSSESVTFEPIKIEKVSDWKKIAADSNTDNKLRIEGIFPLPDEPPLSSYQNPFTDEMLSPEKVKQGIYL